jgi:hypothetical protein
MAWRGELLRDLGGAEQLSTQQLALVDISMRTKLLLDSVDAWLLRHPSIIDKRRRQLFPVPVVSSCRRSLVPTTSHSSIPAAVHRIR